jgi:hypothetical protein
MPIFPIKKMKEFTDVQNENVLKEIVDASNVIIEDNINNAEKTLIYLLIKATINDEIKDKISIKLNSDIINVINKIISLTPNTLTDIEKAATEIIKDQKIDSKDIPNLIIVVQRIYQVIYDMKDLKIDSKKRTEITSSILKFIIHLLVKEEKIKIDDDKQEEFLKNCDILVDSCVGLLSFPKSLKTKGCLKKIFG